MSRPLPKFTYEDYLLLPQDKRYELIEGELILVPSPSFKHQEITGRLYRTLSQFVEKKKIGKIIIAPFDVVLSSTDVVQPDILFVSKERLSIITEENLQGAPDLVAEVLSSEPKKDRVLKRKLYAKYGVKEYWIVDPQAQNIEVMVLDKKGYKTLGVLTREDDLTSTTLSGFTLPLSKLFI